MLLLLIELKANKNANRFNIKKYGLQTREFDFYTYNIASLVEKSATFWMIRKSNTWKLVEFKTYLTHLDLQTWDAITLDFKDSTTSPKLIIVISILYEPSLLKDQLKFDILPNKAS